MRRTALALLLFAISCAEQNSGPPALEPESAKAAAITYLDALRVKDCELALGVVGGELKALYEQMISARNLNAACEAWRTAFLPSTRQLFSYEEKVGGRTVLWFKLYRDEVRFDPIKLEAELIDGVWKVVGI